MPELSGGYMGWRWQEFHWKRPYIWRMIILTFLMHIVLVFLDHYSRFFLLTINSEAQIWLNDLDKIIQLLSDWNESRILLPLFSSLTLSLVCLLVPECMHIKCSNNVNMYKIITSTIYLFILPFHSFYQERPHNICGFIPFYACVWSINVWSIYLVLF